jgi:hypothetical protein
MLTWENTPMQGTAAIMEKLQVCHVALSLQVEKNGEC